MTGDVGRIQRGSIFERAAAGLRHNRAPPNSHLRVNLRAFFHELLGLLFHPLLQRLFLGDALFGGVFADVFGDFHRAEVRAALGTSAFALALADREVRDLKTWSTH